MSYAALGSSGYYPSSWRGGMPSQSSSSNHPSGVPSYFPRPPPMPAGYAYGKRAWTSGSWVCMPEPGPGAAHGYQGRWWSNWGSKSTTKDYWSTELKDNPLDLEGMDIRAPTPPEKPVAGLEDHFLRQRDSNKPDQNRKSWIWVPALSDDSTASSSTVTNQTRHSRTRSSSQPPNERRPRSTEPQTEREQPIESAEFISASSKARPNGMRRGHSIRTQQEYRPAQVDENAPYPPLSGGEESSQNIPRYASADGYRRKRTISASRSFPQPTSSSVQPASQYRVTRESSSRLNGVQRSHTLPVELIQPQPRVPYTRDVYASVNGKRTSSDQPPQTDRHERVNGSHDHARPVMTAYSPGVIRPPQHYESPLHSPIRERGESSYEPREGRRSDRVREWMVNNERSETKPQTRRTVDGYEHLNQKRSYDYGYTSTSHRDLQRHSSMPATTTSSSVVAPVPVYAAQMQHSNSGGQMSDITEEPDDITGGMGRMSVGHSNGHGHSYGHRNGHIRDDVREESPLRSRSGGRRAPLERSATMPTVQEADQYVGRGSFDAHMSRRENRDREYSNEYYSPRRDGDTSPTPASRQSRPHHLQHTSTSTSPYVQRSGAGTPSRLDYMYATPERTQTHHHPYAYQSPNTKTNLGVLNTSTPKHSPLRQQVESPPRRYNSSASITVNQPIISPATLARGIYADSNGFQQAPMSRAPNLERRRSSRQMDEDEDESDSESDSDSEDDGRRRTSGSGSSSDSTRSQSPSPPETRGMPTTNYPPHPHPHPHIQHSHVQIDQIYDTPTRRPHPHPHPHSNPRLTRTPSHPPIGAPIPPLASTPLGRYPRHVRRGFWNRRGDHLTEDSYLVYCPPGRNFPRDLEEYPDLGFKNHLGDIVALPSDSRPEEHPESIPRAGRPAARPYETFIEYVLMDR